MVHFALTIKLHSLLHFQFSAKKIPNQRTNIYSDHMHTRPFYSGKKTKQQQQKHNTYITDEQTPNNSDYFQ